MERAEANEGRAEARAEAHGPDDHGPRSEADKSRPPQGGGDREPPFIARIEGVPLELVLTTFRGRVRVEVDEAAGVDVFEAAFRIDAGPWRSLERTGRRLRGHFDADALTVGPHDLELRATFVDGTERRSLATFRVRQSSG